MLGQFLQNLREIVRWHDLVDILIVSFIIYRVLLLIRGTRAVQMLTGFGIVLILYYASERLGFHTLHTILIEFFNNFILIIIIVFQEEIRKALAQVGRNPFFTSTNTIEEVAIVEELCTAAVVLARGRIGALIVIERETGLKNYIEAGTALDAKVTSDLIVSIFHPDSPIHDGAIIIRNARISSAGCLLPISRDPAIQKEFGTRHRAALGLTHETDAVVIVVSEERGEISLAHHGTMVRDLDGAKLRTQLLNVLGLRKYEARYQEELQRSREREENHAP
ncbi:MAG: TIGR00159 family protein [Deltaproteobacteria bacterium]|nr:TIGR00159 family protein [Deltaproteobacteria bacterium]MBI3294482.1 TIGR00159 family protein [Deltaproteobacteria bacterium]